MGGGYDYWQKHHQAIVNLTERKSRLALLRKVERHTAESVSEVMIGLLQPIADCVHTITADNGKEFADHERIAQELSIDFFFAHPYAAWERGANEYMNGLVRQYIPKNRKLNSVIKDELEMIVTKLNHRPRKCSDFMSPFKIFFNQSVALTN